MHHFITFSIFVVKNQVGSRKSKKWSLWWSNIWTLNKLVFLWKFYFTYKIQIFYYTLIHLLSNVLSIWNWKVKSQYTRPLYYQSFIFSIVHTSKDKKLWCLNLLKKALCLYSIWSWVFGLDVVCFPDTGTSETCFCIGKLWRSQGFDKDIFFWSDKVICTSNKWRTVSHIYIHRWVVSGRVLLRVSTGNGALCIFPEIFICCLKWPAFCLESK